MKMIDRIRPKMQSAIESWQGKRIIVLGDMILDEFIYGVTNRVSREAPVVIVRYDSSGYVPGGAANAVRNVSSLGASAIPVGFVGGDEAGQTLLGILRKEVASPDGLHIFESRTTTTKIRVMAGDHHSQRQQMVRIDKEQSRPISMDEEERIITSFDMALQTAGAVVLSDYGQGLFTGRIIRHAIETCRDNAVPVVADSRFMLTSFKGVTAASPNEVEAAAAAGLTLADDSELESIGRKLLKMLSADSLLVTRGKYGMSLFEKRKRTRSVGVVGSAEATDVTGAGDTVVSVVAMTLAAGGSMEEAMHLANAAASIVVMKRGTAVATIPELMDVISEI